MTLACTLSLLLLHCFLLRSKTFWRHTCSGVPILLFTLLYNFKAMFMHNLKCVQLLTLCLAPCKPVPQCSIEVPYLCRHFHLASLSGKKTLCTRVNPRSFRLIAHLSCNVASHTKVVTHANNCVCLAPHMLCYPVLRAQLMCTRVHVLDMCVEMLQQSDVVSRF